VPSDIIEVSLERRRFLCEDTYRLTFRKDGHATRTRYGNRWRGEPDRAYAGIVSTEAFDTLVATVRGQGFFELQDRYPPPEEDRGEDGAWSTTSVSSQGVTKAVSNSNAQGPSRPELARQFPQIRSYRAAGVGDYLRGSFHHLTRTFQRDGRCRWRDGVPRAGLG
jgi:hypothetical protein